MNVSCTHGMTEIHPRPTYNPFDNCKPTAMVYMFLLCIETYQSDMAHQLYLLEKINKRKMKINIRL